MSTGWEKLKAEKAYSAEWWENIQANNTEISLSDFAKGVDISYSKLYKWVTGEKKMSAYDKGKVLAFINKGIQLKGYKRMGNNDFSKLLHDLLVEFNPEITQQKLAQKIGVTQKTISEYQNSKKNISVDVETQYNILEFFYYMCYTDNGICSESHKNTLLRIAALGIDDGHFIFTMNELVDLNIIQPEEIYDDNKNDLIYFNKFTEIKEKEKFLKYSYDIQCIILNHFKAFCYDYGCVEDNIACINKFRELSVENQNKFIVQLKKSIPDEIHKKCNDIRLGECEDELYRDFFFDEMTEYRDMVKILRENPNIIKQSQEKSNKKTEGNVMQFEKKFSSVIDEEENATCGNYDSDITFKAIDFKLTLSYLEWHVWMLFILSDLSKNDIMNMLSGTQS